MWSISDEISSIEGRSVSLPNCAAAIWSAVVPRRMSAPSVFLGCTPFSHVAQARECSPLPSPSDSPCFCARPLTIVRRSRYGANGVRMGENVKSAPVPFGVQWLMAVVHRDAVGNIDESHATFRTGGRLRRGGKRRHHGVEHGQGDGRPKPAEDCSPGQRHPGNEHTSTSPPQRTRGTRRKSLVRLDLPVLCVLRGS